MKPSKFYYYCSCPKGKSSYKSIDSILKTYSMYRIDGSSTLIDKILKMNQMKKNGIKFVCTKCSLKT